jgi:hypothetical protein
LCSIAAEEKRRASLTPVQGATEDKAKADVDAIAKHNSAGDSPILNATVFAKDNVRRFLKHPNDASFGSWDTPEVKFNPEQDTFWLSSRVKAQNELGTESTYQWEAIVVLDGGTWQLASCAIDGQTVYSSGALLDRIINTEQGRSVEHATFGESGNCGSKCAICRIGHPSTISPWSIGSPGWGSK